jgi:CRP-like cAMP-binding protein
MASSRYEAFRGLPVSVTEHIFSTLPTRHLAAGETLLSESQTNDALFFIEDGEVGVWKGDPGAVAGVHLATFTSGECCGEMSALNGQSATASVVAVRPTTVRTLRLADLPTEDGVRAAVTLNLARTLVSRLAQSTETLKTKHEAELRAMRVLASASGFITRILIALSCYMLALPVIAYVTPLLPTNSLISFLIIIVFFWIVLDYTTSQGATVRDFIHLNLDRWPRQLGRGFLWALPPMGLFLAVKIVIIALHPGQYALWDPRSAFSRESPPGFWLWLLFAFLYVALSFAQEFIRCVVQGTLDLLNQRGTRTRPWLSIFVSGIVFASLHLHLSLLFAVQAALAGLFFGIVFWKERSYLAVAVAHSLVGIWTVFVVGVPAS